MADRLAASPSVVLRTGDWFALKRWGVQPDILAFAKGITSGYLPLGGIMVSRQVLDVMLSVPYADRWMHAYTYSGHATCCAVSWGGVRTSCCSALQGSFFPVALCFQRVSGLVKGL